MVENWIVLLFLVAGTVFDLKDKCIPKIYLFIWGGCAILYIVFLSVIKKEADSVVNALIGIIPGVIGLFLAFVTKEQIGFGDGWVISLAGLFLGIKSVLCIVFSAFAFLTVVAMILLINRRVKGKSAIPFVPFLLIGQITFLCGGRFL